MSLTIECQKRPEGVKPNALRRDGLIPAALYGHKGLETMTLAVKEKDATNLLKEASINKSVIEVKSKPSLIRQTVHHKHNTL